jgi:hypothetical protein
MNGGSPMLSFLYHLANDFEISHGYRANLLYISQHHYIALREELTEINDLEKLTQFLGMDLVFSEEATHPHVVWQPIEWTKVTA